MNDTLQCLSKVFTRIGTYSAVSFLLEHMKTKVKFFLSMTWRQKVV